MKKGIIIALILIAGLVILASSLYTVQESEYACVVRFERIISTTGQAGLHLKTPFVDSVKKFPKAVMFYDIPPSEVLTSDKQNMTVDSYVLWQIENPRLFYQALGTIAAAEQRIDALTYNALKNIMGTLAQQDIINYDPDDEGPGRNDIYAGIAANVSAIAKNYGIQVVDIKVKRFDLPEANEQAVYARMISERNQIAEKYTADGEYAASIIRNDVDKQVNILVSNARAEAAKLEAEGEQEYMRLLSEAYDTQDKKGFYEFVRSLEALKASLAGKDKTIVFGKDSALAQALTRP